MGQFTNALTQAISMLKRQPEVYPVKQGIPLQQFGESYSNGSQFMVDTVDPATGRPRTIPQTVYQEFNKQWAPQAVNNRQSALIQARTMAKTPTKTIVTQQQVPIKPVPTPQATPNLIPSLQQLTPSPIPTPMATPTPQQSPGGNSVPAGKTKKFWAIANEGNKPTRDIIIRAAQEVGVDASLMLDIAAQESVLDPSRRAQDYGFDGKTVTKDGKVLPYSSAAGLFQFTDGTWQEAMRRYPEIVTSMDQRMDPYINAVVAANFIKNRMLSRWNASKDVWGPAHPDVEIAKYYPQS